MKSFIPWVGGKSKLLWLIHKLSPSRYSRFIDVFGGSGTVTLSRPIQQGCIEVYNDFNGDLTNLFCCVKNRTMALLLELGFLPLNTRDDFNVLYKFFSREEFTDDYLDEEMELTQRYLEPPDAKTIRRMMLERAPRGDVRRAADYFKLIRYSFSGGAKSFAGKSCDIRRFSIWSGSAPAGWLRWSSRTRTASTSSVNMTGKTHSSTVTRLTTMRRTAMRWAFPRKTTSASTMHFWSARGM